MTYTFVGGSGGSGVTTLAAATALALARDGRSVRLMSHTADPLAWDALAGAAGCTPRHPGIRPVGGVHPTLEFGPAKGPRATVIDAGTDLAAGLVGSGPHILIVRNEYLALRRVVSALPAAVGSLFDHVVLASLNNRALTSAVVADVLGLDLDQLLIISHDDTTARFVDAGRLADSMPPAIEPAVVTIIRTHTHYAA